MEKRGKNRRTKTLIAVLMVGLLICGCLAGCGSGGGGTDASSQISASDDSGQTAAEKEKKSADKSKTEDKKDKKKEAADEKSGEKTSSGQDGSESSGDDSKAASAGKSGKSSANSSKSNSKSSKNNSKNNSSSKNGSSSSSGSENKVSKCIVSITCHKLVGCDELDSAQRSRVPSSGVIMSGTSVEIKSGDSVYDVLKRAAAKKGVVISAETTSLGIYVSGIGGFYEKDAGAESGWKYKVNGVYPNDSAGDVKVKDGDVIEWVYVLEA